ncbi:MAG TPA: hypothetical protein VLX61_09080 [Anaerolineales bacterium]|nr:hypothetical protein [Anaerolineales bacterium]
MTAKILNDLVVTDSERAPRRRSLPEEAENGQLRTSDWRAADVPPGVLIA